MSVRCAFKDSRDILWIGTDAGLCTFDGKSFRIFKPSEGMKSSQIWAITEDEYGNVWFGSFGDGIFVYDGQSFNQFTQKTGLTDNFVRTLMYSKKHHVLIAGTDKGINVLKADIAKKTFELILSSKTGSNITGLADAGEFIFISVFGFHNPIRYYPLSNKLIDTPKSDFHYPKYSSAVFITSMGDTIFSSNEGVTIYSKKGTVRNDSLGQVFGIEEDKRGNLWFAGWSFPDRIREGGIFCYNGKEFRNFRKSFGIIDREVWSLFYDKLQDILWIGTLNEGLFKVQFGPITKYKVSELYPPQQKINDLLIDSKNRLWISGNHDLIRMEKDQDISKIDNKNIISSFKKYWNAPGRLDVKTLDILIPEHLKDNTDFNFFRLAEDKSGHIIFSNKYGLFSYDPLNNNSGYIIPDGAINEICFIADTLILTGWGYTILYPDYKNSNRNYIIGNKPPIRLFRLNEAGDPRDVNRIVNHGNQIWYASSISGLWMSSGMKLVNFNQKDSTIGNNLNDICFDNTGRVIFCSNVGDICIGSLSGEKIKTEYRINSDNGLIGNSVTWLYADIRGYLWAGTNRGLNCINLNRLYATGNTEIRYIDEDDGYTGQSSRKAVMDSSGVLWVATSDELLRLDTRSFLTDHSKSGKIILKALDINHKPADSSKFKHSGLKMVIPENGFSLDHSENNLVFYIDIFNYKNPRKDRFRYILKGFDKGWSKWNEERQTVFTNLSPGRYTLSIESYNLVTLVQAEPLEINFNIRYPWWGLWYLQALAGALLILLVYQTIYRYIDFKKKKERTKLEIEKKIAQLEMQALQAQMNPHFIFNCVAGIQYYVLANKTDEVLSYLSDFSKVVRASLANASLSMIPLSEEIDFLHSYIRMELMRFPEKFDYSINLLDDDDFSIIRIPPMLVQPFIENAIRHGFANLVTKGQLSVVFEETGPESLKCTITDNGTGRDKKNKKEDYLIRDDRPHSTFITDSRIRLFNNPEVPDRYRIVYTDLTDNGKPCGLKVEIYLPVRNFLS